VSARLTINLSLEKDNKETVIQHYSLSAALNIPGIFKMLMSFEAICVRLHGTYVYPPVPLSLYIYTCI
jgi:hypothetical protein